LPRRKVLARDQASHAHGTHAERASGFFQPEHSIGSIRVERREVAIRTGGADEDLTPRISGACSQPQPIEGRRDLFVRKRPSHLTYDLDRLVTCAPAVSAMRVLSDPKF
jgi:hypothetical protein